VAVKCVEGEHVNVFDVLQVEDGQRVGRSLYRVAQEELFENLEGCVFSQSLSDQLLKHVVHNLHEASHLLLGEFLLNSEVTVEVSKLIDDRDVRICHILKLEIISDLDMVKPTLANSLSLRVSCRL